MNINENLPNLGDKIENKPSNSEVYMTAALLGMNIVNETKKTTKNTFTKREFNDEPMGGIENSIFKASKYRIENRQYYEY